MRIKGLTFKEIGNIRSTKNVHRFNTDLFTFLYTYDLTLKCTIVVKKKIIKLAVKRNKIRRRIRSILSKYGEYGLCIMMIGRKTFEDMSFDNISSDIDLFFKYINRKLNINKSSV